MRHLKIITYKTFQQCVSTNDKRFNAGHSDPVVNISLLDYCVGHPATSLNDESQKCSLLDSVSVA